MIKIHKKHSIDRLSEHMLFTKSAKEKISLYHQLMEDKTPYNQESISPSVVIAQPPLKFHRN